MSWVIADFGEQLISACFWWKAIKPKKIYVKVIYSEQLLYSFNIKTLLIDLWTMDLHCSKGMCILNCNLSWANKPECLKSQNFFYTYDFHIERKSCGDGTLLKDPRCELFPLEEGGFPVKIGWSEWPWMCPEAFLGSHATVPKCASRSEHIPDKPNGQTPRE